MVSNSLFSEVCNIQDRDSKRCRICKLGAGVEKTPQKADTPGFPLSCTPSIVQDIRGFKRLQLPRNHQRIAQTSLLLSQSWRANCDVQILLYDSNPLHPDPEDVARATDYIVAYACKGVETLQEEKRQMIDLILRAHESFSDKTDVQRLARQLLNRTVGEKMISKQEAMVHIGQLDFVNCSESLDTVSISGYYKLNIGKSATTLLKKHAMRSQELAHLTLHQYFHLLKNKTVDPSSTHAKYIPHYVGANSHPQYPPTVPYARSIVLLHTPWIRTFDTKQDFITLFRKLIMSPTCPLHIKIPYLRIKTRVLEKKTSVEPTNTLDDPISPFLSEQIPGDLQQAIRLANMLPPNAHSENDIDFKFDHGLNYDWSKPHYHVSFTPRPLPSHSRNFLHQVPITNHFA